MSVVLKEDQILKERLNQFVQAWEEEKLPDKVKLWISDPDIFGYIMVEATVSTKIIKLNITIDLLHHQVNLFELDSPGSIDQLVLILSEEIHRKYEHIFTAPRDLRQ